MGFFEEKGALVMSNKDKLLAFFGGWCEFEPDQATTVINQSSPP